MCRTLIPSLEYDDTEDVFIGVATKVFKKMHPNNAFSREQIIKQIGKKIKGDNGDWDYKKLYDIQDFCFFLLNPEKYIDQE